jgi:transcriptional regulator with XRE-family HTH domain
MDDMRIGRVFRAVRLRRGWTQAQLGARAGVSAPTISRVERGHIDRTPLDTLRCIGTALEIRVTLTPSWRGADVDRLLAAGHSAMHELLAANLERLPGWVFRPEVSFAVYGERGIIDILAWHEPTRSLLVIELKTEIADVNALVGGVDRKRRLAVVVAADLGWRPSSVSVWVVVRRSSTNDRRLANHQRMLRAAFPVDGKTMRSWLRRPSGAVAALSTVDLGALDRAVPRRRVIGRRARVIPAA